MPFKLDRADRRAAILPRGTKGIVLAALLLQACGFSNGEGVADGNDWPVVGGSTNETFYSPASQIDTDNVDALGLAWHADLDTARGQEANVVMVDGTLYFSTAWSKVYAFDARTGDQLWQYDPEVPGEKGYDACCDVVNRGVAVTKGKVFVGTLDGRLVALDRKTGSPVWETQTTDPAKPYTITGAPRVVKDKVLIGNGGAEYGVRGYVSAYDIRNGDLAWRFYTVPGNPEDGPDNAASDPQMAKAAATWHGNWYDYGGGGTVWDAIVYDEELDQVLIGTGNGSPWNHRIRSQGKGDNLFLSSIIALDPDTGDYRWHYQETPGETWDFTATQPIVLADLQIDGTPRKVLMHAPKNGFFYVIDRNDGRLISAKPFVDVNWAEGVDLETGRPIERPEARWTDGSNRNFVARPGAYGAHSWHPMAYSPQTHLVYIPVQDIPFGYQDDTNFQFRPGQWNLGNVSPTNLGQASESDLAKARKNVTGAIVAWDPVKQEAAWRVQHPSAGNGGILATAGGLIFQGKADGHFVAYDARNGSELWSFDTQAPPIAAASSYILDGKQYVALLAGYGGIFSLFNGYSPKPQNQPIGRLLVFAIGGKDELPEFDGTMSKPVPPSQKGDPAKAQEGFGLFAVNCMSCHGAQGWSSGVLPDLRRSAAINDPMIWKSIVYDGALQDSGMIGFKGKLSPEEVEAIRVYVGERARALADGD
ncbi:PQQ-dependent dehydrogenase, methanol/ethanol family [Croceicoccus sediminis]|uniref:PQQ-dependent dehydrogenase, methanol/ethanol family n=1 Tax=Croceicoccus sediminis TaxID=2571150 RepID=UPI001184204F|nr:PQQ-dependent dehydrogenase, methanol/ethanol family [Croceicoccus sediminis]